MKALLLALTLLASGAAHGQITYETRYPVQLHAFKLSTGVVKYIGYFPPSNSVRIYNNDNSLYKSVAMPTGTTSAYSDFFYLSDKLFNTDSQLEFATSVGSNNSFVMKVFNENGTQLFSQDSCTNAQIYNTPLGTKMFALVYRTSSDPYYKVYALAGTYTPLAVKSTVDDVVGQPYPNPAADAIRLPYQVASGLTGTLDILSVTGQKVASYTIDSTFDHLIFDTKSLAKGIYLYQVTVNGKPSTTKRFIIE